MAINSQLIKKNKTSGGYNNVFPKTFIDAIKDRETGLSLNDILNNFNMYFLSYVGSREDTRLQVPSFLRKRGLFITYVNFSGDFYNEYYNSDDISDTAFGKDDNWVDNTNKFIRDPSISSSGHWVINGVDTGIPATAEIDLEQSTGDRVEAAMSQKAITDALNNLDKDLQVQITELQNTTFPLGGNFIVSPTLFEYTGKDITVSLSWDIQRKGDSIDLSVLNISRTIGGNTATLVSSPSNPGTYSDHCTNRGTIVYTLKATASGIDISKSVTITGTLPMYFGSSANDTINDIDITSFAKQPLKLNPAGTYNMTLASNGYIWFCVPDNMTINKITSNGFDVPLEAFVTKSTSLGGYKCYRGSNELVSGTYRFVIS